MDVKKEFTLLTTLLGIVFAIIGVGMAAYAPTLATSGSDNVIYIALLMIAVLYLKDGIFSFLDGIGMILAGKEKKE